MGRSGSRVTAHSYGVRAEASADRSRSQRPKVEARGVCLRATTRLRAPRTRATQPRGGVTDLGALASIASDVLSMPNAPAKLRARKGPYQKTKARSRRAPPSRSEELVSFSVR